MLPSLVLRAALVASVELVGAAREAQDAFPEKILFASDRNMGQGVNNPTGDPEIFKMNPDGTALKRHTFKWAPLVSPPFVLLMGTAGDEFWMNR